MIRPVPLLLIIYFTQYIFPFLTKAAYSLDSKSSEFAHHFSFDLTSFFVFYFVVLGPALAGKP